VNDWVKKAKTVLEAGQNNKTFGGIDKHLKCQHLKCLHSHKTVGSWISSGDSDHLISLTYLAPAAGTVATGHKTSPLL